MANNSTLLLRNASLDEVHSQQIGDAYIWLGFVIILIILVCNTIPLVVMALIQTKNLFWLHAFLVVFAPRNYSTRTLLCIRVKFRQIQAIVHVLETNYVFSVKLYYCWCVCSRCSRNVLRFWREKTKRCVRKKSPLYIVYLWMFSSYFYVFDCNDNICLYIEPF